MNTKNIALATVLGALLSANAFAAGPQPTAGEGPLFTAEPVMASMVTRAEVQAEATQAAQAALVPHRDASDARTWMNPKSPTAVTRAEAREQTREALASGYHVKTGEQS
ncbi:MAG: hypothetical protein KDG56_05745 [Ottowia sp.]|nr:hypothetical protein [Ottowia sp.]MCB2037574.1 hypothetical protein [Ottowia sp.]